MKYKYRDEIDSAYKDSVRLLQELMNELRNQSENPNNDTFLMLKSYGFSMFKHSQKLRDNFGSLFASLLAKDILNQISSPTFGQEYSFLSLFNQDKARLENIIKQFSTQESSKPTPVPMPVLDEEEEKEEAIESSKLKEENEQLKLSFKDLEQKLMKERGRVTSLKSHTSHFSVKEHDDMDSIFQHMDMLKIVPKNKILDKDAILVVSGKYSNDRKFIENTMNLSFPQISALSLTSMEKFKHSTEIYRANKFMARAIDKPFYVFQFSAEKPTDISRFNIGLRNILGLVKNQVVIRGFLIDSLNLREIIESCSNVHNLVFYDCEIEDLEGFELNDAIDYEIQVLDLFKTCVKEKEKRINSGNIITFAKALGATSLAQSLKRIHVSKSDYDIKDVDYVFSKFGFKASICGDDNWPHTRSHDHDTEDMHNGHSEH